MAYSSWSSARYCGVCFWISQPFRIGPGWGCICPILDCVRKHCNGGIGAGDAWLLPAAATKRWGICLWCRSSLTAVEKMERRKPLKRPSPIRGLPCCSSWSNLLFTRLSSSATRLRSFPLWIKAIGYLFPLSRAYLRFPEKSFFLYIYIYIRKTFLSYSSQWILLASPLADRNLQKGWESVEALWQEGASQQGLAIPRCIRARITPVKYEGVYEFTVSWLLVSDMHRQVPAWPFLWLVFWQIFFQNSSRWASDFCVG